MRFSKTSIILCGFIIYPLNPFALSGFALAESPRAKLNDLGQDPFGQDSVEDGEFGVFSDKPIAPELVEEREPTEPAKKAQESQKEAKKTPGKSDKLSLTKEDEQQIKSALNGNDIEISALIKTFSKLLKRNFITDSTVKGKVTIHLPTPVTTTEALQVFDTVLLLKGFTAVPVTGDTWKIIPARDAKQTTVPLLRMSSNAPSDQLVTEKIKLKHISAKDTQDLITAFISKDGTLKAVEGSNSLIIIDSQANIARLRELIDEVDVPAVDREISIIPIAHAEAKDIADKINDILGGGDDKDKQNQGAAAATNIYPGAINRINQIRPAGSEQSSNDSDRRSFPFKIIPDERTNSIIAVADKEMLLKVQALVEQLDSEVDRSGGRFWVYRLQHADAEELADIISNLISGSSGSGDSSKKTQGSSISRNESSRNSPRGDSGNAAATAIANAAAQRARDQAARTPGATGAAGGAGSSGGGKVNLEGEVAVTADPATNSLLINASRSDYMRVKEVIDILDIKRRQVLVEATILEVRIGDQEGLGVELQGTAGLKENGGIFGQTNLGSITNLLTNPAALTDITIAAASAGSLTLPGGITIPSQAILISAVSKNSNVNVLSSPTILATDNQEAEIIVGENVPFVSSTGTNATNIANTFNQVQRQDVGITLRITPQISTGDYVNLHMFVEISSVVEGTRNDSNGPTTTIRTTETSVEVKDSQMVITGGLIQDQVEDSTRGFPFIEDIPIIGRLFQREDGRKTKTNLLIFITPKVIKDQFDARDQSRYYSKKLSDEIKSRELTPSREDVLDSPNLDNVIETFPGKIDTPSTIRPEASPTRSLLEQNSALESLEDENQIDKNLTGKNQSGGEEKVINVSITPKLPGVSRQAELSEETILEDTENQSSNDQNIIGDLPAAKKIEPKAVELPPLQIAVLRLVSGKTRKLISATDKKTIAVSGIDKFFQVGRRYKHDSQDRYVCLGIYSSSNSLAKAHPGLAKDKSQNQFNSSSWTKE